MNYTDASTKRDLELIPLARQRLGDHLTLFTDSNSSYDVPLALRIGHLLEDHGYGFFEEPVRFDHFEETKVVADALDIAVAGGEQEYSMLVGFESFNAETLKQYHKGINRKNLDDYQKLVTGFHKSGISVFGGFIIGSDEDTADAVADTAVASVKLGIDMGLT